MKHLWKQEILKRGMGLLVGSILTALLFYTDFPTPPSANIVFAQQSVTSERAAIATPRLQYQGQLLDPATGQPVVNGEYSMTFRLYNGSTGGTALWTTALSINTTDGLFTTLLAVEPNLFNSQDLYLSVQVGADPEAAPRQPVAYVGYAFRADRAGLADNATAAQQATNADQLDGIDSSGFVRLGNNGLVAYGVVDANGTRIAGTNFSSLRDGNGVYQILINGKNYNLNNFVTMVTSIVNSDCAEPMLVGTGSDNGSLLVDVFDRAGNRRACKFHFVTFEP